MSENSPFLATHDQFRLTRLEADGTALLRWVGAPRHPLPRTRLVKLASLRR